MNEWMTFIEAIVGYKLQLQCRAGLSGRAVWGVCLDRLYAETVGSNPTKGMFVLSYSSSSFTCHPIIDPI
jgi:hypothetical protein